MIWVSPSCLWGDSYQFDNRSNLTITFWGYLKFLKHSFCFDVNVNFARLNVIANKDGNNSGIKLFRVMSFRKTVLKMTPISISTLREF